MGKWKYRKPEPSNVRGLCVIYNKNSQKPKSGGGRFYAICRQCDKKLYNGTKKKPQERDTSYKKYKGDSCSHCGFIPLHKCQLDVDHIDGNRTNNDLSNLRTLCANCHRLKTYTDLLE